MLWLLTAGGVPGALVLLMGVVGVGVAGECARRPSERRLELVRALSRTTFCLILAGTASCLATVCLHITARPEWGRSPDLPLILLEGLAESLAPVIIGFTLLAAIAVLGGIGRYRMHP